MKLVQITILVILITSLFFMTYQKTNKEKKSKALSKSHTKTQSKIHSKKSHSKTKAKSQSKSPKHISEVFYGGTPNSIPVDRHYLWKDYHKNQFERPHYHGVSRPSMESTRSRSRNSHSL